MTIGISTFNPDITTTLNRSYWKKNDFEDLFDTIRNIYNIIYSVSILAECFPKLRDHHMEQTLKSEKVVIKVGPPDNPYAKIIRRERRLGSRERRRLNTYIVNDRRGGLSDRRKPVLNRLKRVRIEDRRQLHTYIAKDRRSGIADRRDPKKRVPSWFRPSLR
jgi:hypothetical protein